MKTKLIGAGILLVVIIAVVAVVLSGQGAQTVTIKGYVGGEKLGFLEDPQVDSILANRYHLTLDAIKSGSLDMARADNSGMDFLFPSSSLAAELYSLSGGKTLKSDDVFVSPLVIYSWDTVTDALMAKGIVSQIGTGTPASYTIDMKKLVDLVESDATWADIGVPELYGQICVYSTDPVHSNSGNLMTALVATVLNGGKTVTAADLPAIEQPLDDFLSKSGYKETSSADLFSSYLRTGVGGKALVALYENQMIEFAAQNPSDWNQIKDKVRILYPIPSVWSNHRFIAIDDAATRFFDAMKDADLLKSAWEVHGFRIGASGGANLTEQMKAMGILQDVTQIIQIPSYDVMNEIMNQLS